MNPDSIKVLLVDDHKVVIEGLGALLRGQPDFEIVGETGSGEDALRLVQQGKPDVVVMDVGLEGADGIEVAKRLRQESQHIQIVILSMYDDAATVDRALRAGARGYVLKGGSVSILCDAIRRVNRGEVFLSPEVSDYVLQGYLNAGSPSRDPLSERERQILRLIAEGFTGRQIAEKLGLKPKTVDNHRASIMEKLSIHTTAGLVRYALREGIASL